MFCPYCGTQNAEYSKFCAGCGAKIGAEQPVMEQPQPVFEAAPVYEPQTVCDPQPVCDPMSISESQSACNPQPICEAQPVQQPFYQPNMYQQPSAQPTYYQQPMYPAYQQPAPLPGKGLGIAGMILGIVSLVCCCVWYISGLCAVVGLILSIVSVVQGRKAGKTNGYALAGIICCAIGLLFAAIMLLAFIGNYDSFMTEMEMYTKEY